MAKTTDPRYFGDKAAAKQRRKLFEQIERLESEIRLAQETVTLQGSLLEQRRGRKLGLRRANMLRPLDRLRLKLASPEEAANEQLADRLPALKKRQRLAYRLLRQNLRRKEGLLDKAGRLKDGQQALSDAALKELEALETAHKLEQSSLYNSLLENAKARLLPQAERETGMSRYRQGVDNMEGRLKRMEARQLEKDTKSLAAFEKRQLEKVKRYNARLKDKQAKLRESESQAEHHLPEDVILRLDGLSMTFGGLKAVDNLSFDVKHGEIFGLIGPNGAGKTTVFNCITQFYKPTAGSILYRTREGNVLRLNNYEVHKIITKGIVRTFQNVEVIGELSILENLLIAAHPQYNSSLWQQIFNTRKVRQEEQVIRQRALQVLEYCGLSAIRDLPPVGQPYGVLKRIELARTLMAGANLIILDEPAAGLNDQETIELTRLIRRIQKDYDATIFLVEHNMGLVMDLCDNICAISFGKKLAYGTPGEIQNDQLVQDAYLGTSEAQLQEVTA